MARIQQCFNNSDSISIRMFMCELSYKFLHDLHHGQATNEQTYIQKNVNVCN